MESMVEATQALEMFRCFAYLCLPGPKKVTLPQLISTVSAHMGTSAVFKEPLRTLFDSW